MWILLISPFESSTNEWEAVVLPSEAACDDEALRRDITKDHFMISAHQLANVLIDLQSENEEGDESEESNS